MNEKKKNSYYRRIRKMSNNPAKDQWWGTPKGTLDDDYEHFLFEDLQKEELFYFSDDPRDNVMYRKLNDTEAMGIKSREIVSVYRRAHTYVKN